MLPRSRGARLKEQPPLGMSRVLGGSRVGNEMLLLARETHHRSRSRQRRSHRARRAKRGGVSGRGSGVTSPTHELPALCPVCLLCVPSHYSVRSRGHPALFAWATQETQQMFGVDCVWAGVSAQGARVCGLALVTLGVGDTRCWRRCVFCVFLHHSSAGLNVAGSS